MFTDLFKFNGMMRWPRPLTVRFHNCSFEFLQAFPGYMLNRTQGYGGFFDGSSDRWYYDIPVPTLTFQIDHTGAKKERYIRLERELDKRRIFWPFSTE